MLAVNVHIPNHTLYSFDRNRAMLARYMLL